MSGRFAAVSKQTIPDAMRERFGLNFLLPRWWPWFWSFCWSWQRRFAVSVLPSNCSPASVLSGGACQLRLPSGCYSGNELSASSKRGFLY
jgi:hypothetical protein